MTKQSQLRSLRVRFWYGGLVERLKARNRSDLIRAALQGRLPPGDTGINRTRLKQWQAYENGSRAPRSSLVKAIDQIQGPRGHGSGSAVEFHAVLWDVLSVEDASPATIDGWFRRLDKHVLRAIRDAPALCTPGGPRYRLPALRSWEFIRLRNRPSLDSLALLSLMVIQAHRFGHAQLARDCANEAVSTLWQLALLFHRRRMAVELMQFYEEWVLPLADCGALRLSMGRDLKRRADVLDYYASLRMSRFPRECKDTAAAKFVRGALRQPRWANAARHQFSAVHKLVPDRCPTADDVVQLWWDMAVSELLCREFGAWVSISVKLDALRSTLLRLLTGEMSANDSIGFSEAEPAHAIDARPASVSLIQSFCPHSSRRRPDPVDTVTRIVPLSILREFCPRAMRSYDMVVKDIQRGKSILTDQTRLAYVPSARCNH